MRTAIQRALAAQAQPPAGAGPAPTAHLLPQDSVELTPGAEFRHQMELQGRITPQHPLINTPAAKTIGDWAASLTGATGPEQFAQGVSEARKAIGGPRDLKYAAATDILGGAMGTLGPYFGGAEVAAGRGLNLLRAVAAATVGGKATKEAVKAAGGSPAAQSFGELAGSFVPGAGEVAGERMAEARRLAAERAETAKAAPPLPATTTAETPPVARQAPPAAAARPVPTPLDVAALRAKAQAMMRARAQDAARTGRPSPMPPAAPQPPPAEQEPNSSPIPSQRFVRQFGEYTVKRTADGRTYLILPNEDFAALRQGANGELPPGFRVNASFAPKGYSLPVKGTPPDLRQAFRVASDSGMRGVAFLPKSEISNRSAVREESFFHGWQDTLNKGLGAAHADLVANDSALTRHPAFAKFSANPAYSNRSLPIQVGELAAHIGNGTHETAFGVSDADAADWLKKYFTAADAQTPGAVAHLKGLETLARKVQSDYLTARSARERQPASLEEPARPVPPVETGRGLEAGAGALSPNRAEPAAEVGTALDTWTKAIRALRGNNEATKRFVAANLPRIVSRTAKTLEMHARQLAPDERTALLRTLDNQATAASARAWLLDRLRRPEADAASIRADLEGAPFPESIRGAIRAALAPEDIKTPRGGSLGKNVEIPNKEKPGTTVEVPNPIRDYYNWKQLNYIPGLAAKAPSEDAFAEALAKTTEIKDPVRQANRRTIIETARDAWRTGQAELAKRIADLSEHGEPTIARRDLLTALMDMRDKGRWFYMPRTREPNLLGPRVLSQVFGRNLSGGEGVLRLVPEVAPQLRALRADIDSKTNTLAAVEAAKAQYEQVLTEALRHRIESEYNVQIQGARHLAQFVKAAGSVKGAFQDVKDFNAGQKAGATAPPVLYHVGASRPTTPAQGLAAAWLKAKNIAGKLAGDRSPELEFAQNVIRHRLAEAARSNDVARAALNDAFRHFGTYGPDKFWDFAKTFEEGKPFADPQVQVFADQLRAENRIREAALKRLGLVEQFNQNYLPHRYTDVKRAMRSFMRQRKLATFADAQAAGLIPETWNPAELFLHNFHDIDRVLAYHQIAGDLKDAGYLKRVRSERAAPPGWQRVNNYLFPEATKAVLSKKTGEPAVVRWTYYAPPEVADIMNSLGAPGLRGHISYDAVHGFNNAVNASTLGLSAYHGKFTVLNLLGNRINLAYEQMGHFVTHGDLSALAEGAKNLASTLSGGLDTIQHGARMRFAWDHPTEMPALQPFVQAMTLAGGRARMDYEYSMRTIPKFQKSLAEVFQGRLSALPRTAWWGAWSTLEYVAKPIMEHLVPLAKMGTFYERAAWELKNTRPDFDPEALPTKLGKIWDDVDNRYGQVVYDNWFLNPKVKDALFANIRSTGWTFGTFRGTRDFLTDTSRFLLNAAQFKRPEITNRMTYPVGMATILAAYNGLMTFLATGSAPSGLDFLAYRNGNRNPDGSDQRMWPASYARDAIDWYTDATAPGLNKIKGAAHTAENKLAGVWQAAFQLSENRDWQGVEIWDPHASLDRQVWQTLTGVARMFLPVTVQNLQQVGQAGGGGQGASLVLSGDTLAPRHFGDSEAQKVLYDGMQEQFQSTRTRADYDKSVLRDRLRNELAAKTLTLNGLKRYQGQFTNRELVDIVRESREPPLVRTFHSADWDTALRAWKVATPIERHELVREMTTKTIGHLRTLTPDQRKPLQDELFQELKDARTDPSAGRHGTPNPQP